MRLLTAHISLTTFVAIAVFLYARAYAYIYNKSSLKTTALFSLVLLSFFVFSSVANHSFAATGINRTINFQGKLVNLNGTNVADNTYSVVFSFYHQTSGGTAVWSETQSVTTTDGIFRVALGSSTPIPADFNFNWDGLYLGMKVGSDSEMTPRIRMSAVPYAFNAEKVAGLTVQDENGNASTSGTLKIPNQKTISFSDAFTTSGAGAVTLTNAADGYTLLAGLTSGTQRTLTMTGADITIGSTIKPTSAGGLTVQSNGANTLTIDTGGAAALNIGATANALTFGATNNPTYAFNGTGTFTTSSGTNTFNGDVVIAASKYLRLTGGAGDPTNTDGIIWYDTTADKFKIVENGVVKIICNTTDTGCGSSGGGTGASAQLATQDLGNVTLANAATYLNTVSITPSTASGDIFVRALLWTRSLSATDQTITVQIRVASGSTCNGALLTSQTASLVSASGANGPSVFATYVEVDPGITSKSYAVCALSTLNNGAAAGGLASAEVIDSGGAASPFNENAFGTISAGNDTLDFLLGSDATASAKFSVLNMIGSSTPTASVSAQNGLGQALVLGGDGNIQSVRRNTLTLGGTTTGDIQFKAGNVLGISLRSNGDIAIGGNNTNPLASLDIRPNYTNGGGTLAVASISGTTSFASLIADNTLGDIFTASSSGLTRFVIRQDGNIGIGTNLPQASLDVVGSLLLGANSSIDARSSGTLSLGTATNTTGLTIGRAAGTLSLPSTSITLGGFGGGSGNSNAVLYVNSSNALAQAVTTGSGQCLLSNGAGGNPSWGSCPSGPGGGGDSWFVQTSGNGVTTGGYTAIGNLTTDFFVGGISTQAAKFAVLNVNNGTPVASSAGNISLGAASGTVRTLGATAMNALQLGDSTTGDLIFAPANSPAMTIKNGGNIGIGVTLPTAKFDIAVNALTTGTGMALTSTSTTFSSGYLAHFSYNPGSTPSTSPTGDLLRLSLGSNATNFAGNYLNIVNSSSASVLSVSDTQFTTSLPANFSSAGDVSMSYDLVFTNPTASYIKSAAPLYIVSGETFGSSNLALQTYNEGTIVLDTANITGTAVDYTNSTLTTGTGINVSLSGITSGTGFNLAQTTSSFTGNLAAISLGNGSGTALNITNGGTGLSLRVNDNGTFTDSTAFVVDASGNVGIGTTAPSSYNLDVQGTARFTGAITVASCSGCGGGPGGSSNWTVENGVLRPNNNSTDLLLGGTSTGSAKFAFLNLNPNSGQTPLASFAGNLRLEKMDNSSAADQTSWTKVSQTTAGTIASGGTASIASISASVVYNGSLYVGTYRDQIGSAEVYRYDGGTSWTKVSQTTAGTIASGGTATIASVSAMTVFDGYLYIGTSKMNAAEVYRYEGGTTWKKVSAATAGTIKTGGTANIDGIASMAVFQGRLYVGTREGAAAQLYRYDGALTGWSLINATAGTFVATNTVAVTAISSMAVYNGVLYLGLEKPGDADVVRYLGGGNGGTAGTFLAVNAAGTTGAYNLDGTSVTAFDAVPAMAVYNGALVIGLYKRGGGADVYVMVGAMPGETPINSFTRLNHAAGQMAFGGTSGIDGISSMTIYNGMLYIGTMEPNGAEIYRYTGGDQGFMRVSNAAGTIASGDTSAIDSIPMLQPVNGDLYAGTFEVGKAEVYRHTSYLNRSYALKFHATSNIAGGEQNGFLNEAQLYYVASASANLGSAAGNTGALVSSHGIQTRNGSYDVAEDYPTRDDSLEPTDLVSIDVNERGFVKKSETGDTRIIGVYSEKPALRLTQQEGTINGGRAVPIALAGRVEVKVSLEGGEIKAGDYLTASSIPGVAKKATKAGEVFGKALSGFDGAEGEIGKVLVFVDISYVDSATVLASMTFGYGEGITIPEEGVSLWDTEQGLTVLKQTATDYDQFQDYQFNFLQNENASLSARLSALEQKFETALASSSAISLGTPITSVLSASTSAILDPYGLFENHYATVSGELMVLGRTTLGDVGVTGNITAGLITIKGLNSEINSIAGPLKLQNGMLDGLEFVGGNVTIDAFGNIVTKASVSTKKLNITTDDVSTESASIGEGIIKKGSLRTIVETTAVTEKSYIFVTPKLFGVQLVVTDQIAGKSFTVEMDPKMNKDVKFNWWIVN